MSLVPILVMLYCTLSVCDDSFASVSSKTYLFCLSVLTDIFSRRACISRYQNVSILDFIGAKDDGTGGLTTGAIRRAKLQSNHHQQTNQHPMFYRPDVLPVTQSTVSEY